MKPPARPHGFTDEELNFILNYDIKYRLGRDTGEEDRMKSFRTFHADTRVGLG